MNVTVFGLGYVGSVTAACLASRGHRVVGVDTDPGKVALLNAGVPPVLERGLVEILEQVVSSGSLRASTSVSDGLTGSDISLVCVGTPSAANGSTDLRQVEKVVAEIGRELAGSTARHTVVVRSTVPPGTVEEVVVPVLERASGRVVGGSLQVAMCPEFLREGTSVADFFEPPFLVVGGSSAATAAVRELFGFVNGPTHEVDLRSAESLKYACNAFHALKVSFANELARLYRMLHVDSRQVMEVFVGDRQLNVSPAYLRPGFAFGGSCLPKDLRSLLHLARVNSVDLPVLQGALVSNEMLVRDVAERVLYAVEAGGGHNRRVALLGLSFKSNTDDLRESPNVALAEMMLGKGLDVRIHDPYVNASLLTGANLRYVQDRLPHLHRVLHDNAKDALDGAQVAVISTADPTVIGTVLEMRPPVVVDLDGRLGTPVEQLAGYQGVGW